MKIVVFSRANAGDLAKDIENLFNDPPHFLIGKTGDYEISYTTTEAAFGVKHWAFVEFRYA